MPLQLRGRMRDEGDRYVVAIPAGNVDKDQLQLRFSEGRRHLLVKGVSLPTSDETLHMQGKVQSRLDEFVRTPHSSHVPASEAGGLIAKWYADAGRGVFGVFKE